MRDSTVMPQRAKTNPDESMIATQASRTIAAMSDGASAGRVNPGVARVFVVPAVGRTGAAGTPFCDDPTGGRPLRAAIRRGPRRRRWP
ncbi:hypothetical protein [Curtobacterium sp. 24E2]